MKLKQLSPLFVVVAVGLFLSGCDPYADLLKKQSYKQLSPPRDAFGTGTIMTAGDPSNIKAGPDDCFPDLDPKIKEYNQVLLNAKDAKGLDVNVAANYLPVAPATIRATFGYKTLKKIDVSYGPTKGNALTDEAFEQYLEGRKLKVGCARRLKDPQNRLIVGVAQVTTMTYTFHGEKTVGASMDAAALRETLKAKGVLNYTNNQDESLTISQPMFIAYRDVRFEDLGIPLPEASESDDATITLKKGQFKLRSK